MSAGNDKIDCANIDFVLEEEYMDLIHKVVSARAYCPTKIKKKDKDFAKMKAKLLKMKMKRKNEPLQAESLDKETSDLLDCSFRLETPDSSHLSRLHKELDNFEKVFNQLRHDRIHTLTREAIDSESIHNKVRQMT